MQPNRQPPQAVPIQSVPIQQTMQYVQPGQQVQYIQSGQQVMMVQPGQQIIIQQGSSGMSLTSLIFGIGSVLCYLAGWFICITFLVAWIFGIFAIIFGHMGHVQSKQTGEGGGLGIAGFTLGYLTLLGYIIPFLGLSI